MGMFIAIFSGLLMSVQGVFNTRLTEKTGIWFTNSLIHAVGFLVAISVFLFVRDGSLSGLRSVNKLYLLGGVLGAGIVYSVVIAISKLGPAQATMLILFSQVIASYAIEFFGLFDTEKVGFVWQKAAGVFVMICGILLFEWGK
jgi:transporter family-2 protein